MRITVQTIAVKGTQEFLKDQHFWPVALAVCARLRWFLARGLGFVRARDPQSLRSPPPCRLKSYTVAWANCVPTKFNKADPFVRYKLLKWYRVLFMDANYAT